MLGAGRAHRIGQIAALIPAHLGFGQSNADVRVFAGSFALRPQRGSRATSSIGAKVIATPSAAASLAASRAVSAHRSGSKAEASPRGMGKSVRYPWMTIESDEQWNAEPGLLDRQALHLANRGRAGQIEQISMVPARMASVESPAMVGPVTVEPAAVMVS